MPAPDDLSLAPLPELLAAVLADDEFSSEARRLAEEVQHLQGELTAAPRAERLRLAAWFKANEDTIRGFCPDGLTTEFVGFLLTIEHA